MQWSLFFKLANLAWEFFPVWPIHLLKDNLTAEGAMVEEQVEENHKYSLLNLYSVRPIFKGNKICSRKNSVHIIFVSVPSIERTLLFRRNRHFFGVPKPGFNLELGYTFVLKTWPTQRGLIPGGGYSHTLHIRVCAAQRGRDFEAPDLERGIHFRGVF